MTSVSKRVQISVFRKNTLGYSLLLCSILLELFFAVKILDSIQTGVMMGISCAINILLLFALFGVAVKVNVYQPVWSYYGLAIGCYALFRAFVLLPFVLKPESRQALLFSCTFVEGVLVVAGSWVSLIRSKKRAAFLATKEGQALIGKED